MQRLGQIFCSILYKGNLYSNAYFKVCPILKNIFSIGNIC